MFNNRTVWIILGVMAMLSFTSFVPNHRGASPLELGVYKVVIDAGHGGHDPGNLGTGRYKVTEKDIALNVSLKLGEYIQRAFPDVDVVYTRKADKFVTLKDRTAIANKANADLFISIHCNSAGSTEAHGTETFVMGLDKTEANLKLAQRENSVILLEENYEQVYGGFDPESPESLIARQIAQSVYLDQSLDLSAKIQKQYRERVSRRDRGVKQAPYWVISFTTMPSVLTELGFLTHKGEEDFLNSENGQVYMASAIYRAFKEYKAEIEGVEVFSRIPVDSHLPNIDPGDKVPPSNTEPKPEEGVSSASQDEVTYKIQLLASGKKIDTSPGNFKGLEGVEEYISGDIYKYTVGSINDYKKAVSLQRKIRENAFPEAFIIAFYKGGRIPMSRALEISNSQKKKPVN